MPISVTSRKRKDQIISNRAYRIYEREYSMDFG